MDELRDVNPVLIRALCRMAKLHGRHVSPRRALSLLRDAGTAKADPIELLAMAWARAFPTDSISARIPADKRGDVRLPAWAELADGSIAIVTGVPAGERLWQLDHLATEPISASPPRALVSPRPGLRAVADSKISRATRATRAIRVALTRHRGTFAQAAVASVVVNVLALLTSLFSMQVYDRVVPNFAYATLWTLSVGMFVVLGIDLSLRLLRAAMLESATRRIDQALSRYFFERIMALRLDRRPQYIGTLVSQVRDYESVKAFFTSTTLFAIADLPFALMFVFAVYWIGGPIAWVPLACLPACLVIGAIAQWPMAKLQRANTRESSLRNGLLYEAIDGAETVKSSGADWRFSELWDQLTRRIVETGERLRHISTFATMTAGSLQQLAYVGTIIFGVYLIEAGHLSQGGLIACSMLASRSLSSIAGITGLLVQWQQARTSLGTLNQLLAAPADDDTERTATAAPVTGAIEVAGARFSYTNPLETALAIGKLEIKPGERVAVIGRNGSGKTTLLKLLAGLFSPLEGGVRISGVDAQQADQQWLRQVVGVLSQDVRLFAGTLRDNMTIGLNLVDEEEIRRAAKATGLLAMIEKHPRGLDMELAEGGRGLSGGQRQLVGLTRLQLANPQIYLLDEPTASLDKESEDQMMSWVKNLPADKTVVFTTHRMSWLQCADRVIVMESGRIATDSPKWAVQQLASGQQPRAAAVKATGA